MPKCTSWRLMFFRFASDRKVIDNVWIQLVAQSRRTGLDEVGGWNEKRWEGKAEEAINGTM